MENVFFVSAIFVGAKFGENFNNFFKFPKFEKKNQLKKRTPTKFLYIFK